MKKYEAVIILDEHLAEDQGKLFAVEFAALLKELGGVCETSLPMGRKQFTYEIKKRKTGVYWNFVFELPEKNVVEIKKKYNLDERILRFRILEYGVQGKKATLEDL